MAVKWQTGLDGGLVVANPIPEQFAMAEEKINAAIDRAVKKRKSRGCGQREYAVPAGARCGADRR